MVIKNILIILFVFILAYGEDSLPYCSLAQPLENHAQKIVRLDVDALKTPEKKIIEHFCSGVKETLSTGELLAKSSKIPPERLEAYLKDLRRLVAQEEEIYQLYRTSISDAIQTEDKKRFEHLTQVELEPLHQPRIRAQAIEYYQKNFPPHSIKSLDSLCDEQTLEKKSIQFMIEQEKAYEEHLKILKRSEVKNIKRTAKIGSKNSVIVVADRNSKGEIVFEAENLNPFLVTLSLDLDKINNLKASHPLPVYVELAGHVKKEIVTLTPLNPALEMTFESSYGWVKGSAFAKHDDTYVYRLPFASGSNVRVSQGYNGGLSHTGLSAYAVDFSVAIGTPVYAAREGEVVGVEVSNDLGGPYPQFRPYMNYVNIRHSDGTLGNYYHLKQGGSAVKIGDTVKKGQLIAYSGNTGYTTAPHLHFSVSMVDPVSMRRPMNLPVKIQALEGIVTAPKCGDHYTVQ
jgi:murein DD-endopeptidase MepM/ murein hydrolase activator NlpD